MLSKYKPKIHRIYRKRQMRAEKGMQKRRGEGAAEQEQVRKWEGRKKRGGKG